MTSAAPSRGSDAAAWSFELVAGAERLHRLSDEWRALDEASAEGTVFQSWEWHQAWWDAMGRAQAGCEPLIGRLRRGGRTVGILPLMRVSLGARTVLRFLTSPVADYHDWIGAGPLPGEAIDRVAEGLAEDPATDGVELDEVSPRAILDPALDRLRDVLSAEIEPSSRCPYAELGAAPGRRVGMSQYARKARRLEVRAAPLAVDHLTDAREVRACLDDYFRMHTDQWRARADVAGSFEEAANVRFFEALVDRLAPRGWLLLSRLRSGDRAIAYDLSFRRRGVLSTYRATFARDMAADSPGHVLLARLLAVALAQGVREVDFLRGEYSYKAMYATGERRSRRLRTRASTIPLARDDGIVALSSLRPLPPTPATVPAGTREGEQ
ncbi:MAG TPA: GNAT family N-acetyltransferase [Kofleriaceae bacterium]|nr:GNAT family N-acetyltransferase [Kofleriaceae bacterium]